MSMIDSSHERIDVRLKRAIETRTMPKELLICGPAGTGKTYPILAVLHTLCRDNSGLRCLILRATRVSLTESVLVTFEQEILPADGCESLAEGPQRSQRRSYRYPNGSEIVVGGLDRNPTKILSTAWDIVFANEAIELSQESWETIGSRMERPGRDRRLGYLIGDTNPAHPGHWLKTRCDAGSTTLWTTRHEANLVLHHGRDWTDAGRAYLARLDMLTGPRRKRLRDGLWAQGDGIWFDTFDPDVHVTELAEYVAGLKTYLAIDSGVWTGAVWFQVREQPKLRINVIDCYLSESMSAERNARAIKAKGDQYGRLHKAFTDPAGGSRNPVGPTVIAEYERVGLTPLDRWPMRSVADGLELVLSFLGGDGNAPILHIHPRCQKLIDALVSYARAKRAGQLMDWPEDPQHPAEEMIDSLRGGLCAVFPDARAKPPNIRSIHASRL
jgi:phage terminase large subunit